MTRESLDAMLTLPDHPGGAELYHNEHLAWCLSLADWDRVAEPDWISDEERRRSLEVGEVWRLRLGVSSAPVHAPPYREFTGSTLAAVVEAALGLMRAFVRDGGQLGAPEGA